MLCGIHPADGSGCFYTISQRSQHPGTVGSHRESQTTDPVFIYHWQGSQKLGTTHIIHVDKSPPGCPHLHEIGSQCLLSVITYSFLSSAFSPKQGVDRQYYVTVLCKVISGILSVITTDHPIFGISRYFRRDSERTYHFLFADGKVCSMIVQHYHSRKRPLSVRNQ